MIKKALIAWFAAVTVSSVWGLLTCQVFFKWVYYLESGVSYRASMLSLEPSWLVGAGIFNFIFTGMFVAAYALIYKALPGRGIQKGLLFGFLIWLIGHTATILHVYLTLNLSAGIVVYWILDALIVYLMMGGVIAAVYKR